MLAKLVGRHADAGHCLLAIPLPVGVGVAFWVTRTSETCNLMNAVPTGRLDVPRIKSGG